MLGIQQWILKKRKLNQLTKKKILSSRVVLAYPDWKTIEDTPFNEYSDASKDGFDVVITQKQKGEDGTITEKIILYDSRRTTKSEVNYDASILELACFYGYVKHMSTYYILQNLDGIVTTYEGTLLRL